MEVLRRSPVEGCCGAELLSHFGWAKNTQSATGPRDLNMIKRDLKFYANMKHVGLRFVFLSEEQIPHVEHLLKEAKFVPVVKNFWHEPMKTHLTLYVNLLNPPKETTEVGALSYHDKPKPAPEPVVKKAIPAPVDDYLLNPISWSNPIVQAQRPIYSTVRTSASVRKVTSPRPTAKPTYRGW